MSKRIASCLLGILLLLSGAMALKIVHNIHDLDNANVDAVSWTVDPPSLNAHKSDYCEGPKIHLLGGLVYGPGKTPQGKWTAGPTVQPTFTKTFAIPFKHFKVKIKFRVYALHSTDGCPGTPGYMCCGPDYFRVRVDDIERYADCSMISRIHPPLCHNYDHFGTQGGGDVAKEVEFTIPHNASTLKIQFKSEVDEPLDNEGYGWAHLWIEVFDGPENCLTADGDNSCATCDPSATLVRTGNIGNCVCKAGLLVKSQSPLSCKGNCPSCGACNNLNMPTVCTACPANSWPAAAGTTACTCNAGYYPAAYAPLVCSQCHSSCAQCSGSSVNQCTACRAGMALNAQHQCVCAPGFYQSQASPLTCTACHSSCATCNGPNANQCLTCKEVPCPGCGLLKLISGSCIHCDPHCADCGTSATDCIKCSPSAVILGAQPHRNCGCAVGYYPTPGSKPVACTKCTPCTACAADGSCSACSPLATLVHSGPHNSGSCVCNPGTYKTSDSPVTCVKCHASCTTCSGALDSQCTACPVDTVLSGGHCVHCDATCLHCNGVGANHCTECTANAHKVAVAGASFKCQCNDGFYGVVTAGKLVCQKCDPSCHTCSGPAANQCTSCNAVGVLSAQAGGHATCTCKDGQYVKAVSPQLTCAACPAGCQHCTSDAKGTMKCTSCFVGFKLGADHCFQCHKTCHDCNGPNDNQCTHCGNNEELTAGKCHCKPNFYSENPAPMNCQPYRCDGTCKTCIGPHRNQCTSCPEHYEKQSDNSCKQFSCHANCLDCSGKGEFDCKVCRAGAEIHQISGKNHCQCKPGYYASATTPGLVCTACDRTCVTCSGAGATHCATCPANAHLVNGACQCVDGFHDDGHLPTMNCVKCPAGCKTCDKNGHCLTCPAAANNAHVNIVNGACVTCSNICANCTAAGDNHCTACPAGATLHDVAGGKTCACANGHYTTNKNPLTCGTCSPVCAECSGTSNSSCTKCTDGAIFVAQKPTGNTCQCAPGYYASSHTPLHCAKCHADCKTCSGPGANQCLSCHAPHNLDIEHHTCITCDPSCVSCEGPGPNHCTGCPSNALLDTARHECHCKPGFHTSNAAGKPLTCSACASACHECTGAGADTCTKCSTNQHLSAVGSTGHTCKCDDGFFATTVSPLTCMKCDASCVTCHGVKSTDCTACKPGQKLINGKCITCSTTCGDCNGEGEYHCTKCTAGADLVTSVVGTTCKCKGGYAATSTNPLRCEAYTCDHSCRTCKGPKNSDCTACPDDHDLVNGICKVRNCHATCIKCDKENDPHHCSACTTGADLASDKSCKCKDGYFTLVPSPLTCGHCDPSCHTCNGEGAAHCVTCVQNAKLVDHACICNDGFWANHANNGFHCEHCHTSCHTCNGPNSDNCKSCPAGKKLFAGRCITCNANCKDCDGEASNRCTECPKDAELVASGDGHTCACKHGFWSATHPTLHCEKYHCDSSCGICHGPHKDHCDSCHEGFKLVNHQCVPVICDSNCISCDPEHPTVCKSCTTGADLTLDKKCHCDLGYAPVSLKPLKCDKIKCHETCATCIGTKDTECSTCIEHAELHKASDHDTHGTCKCKSDFFQQRNHCEACDKKCKTCKGPNHNECTACADPKAHLVNGACIVCDKSCTECKDSTPEGCTACDSHHVLSASKNGKQCVCPTGYHGDKCDQYTCDASCATCDGPGANHCKTCKDKDHVIANGVCRKADCDVTCAECSGPRGTDCTKCGGHQELSKIDAKKGICQCAPGYYNKGEKGKALDCQPCDHSCKTCTAAGSKACSSCFVGAHFDAASKSCACHEGTFLQIPHPFHCATCDKSCKTCNGTGSHHCLTCHTGDELVNGTCVTCAAQCKTCTAPGSHCASCDSTAHLVDVPASGHNPAGKTCVCPDGMFSSGHSHPLTCTKCDDACKTCNGAGPQHCISCKADHSGIHTNKDGSHECQCVAGYHATKTHPLTCEKTVCDHSCATCHAPGPHGCTTCPKGSVLHNGACTKYECHAGCKDCTGPEANQCTSCLATLELVSVSGGKTCQCAKGYEKRNTTHEEHGHESHGTQGLCQKIRCHEYSCKTCLNDQPKHCIECERNTVMRDGECVCEHPNFVWQMEPYVCSETYVDYVDSAEDPNRS